MGLSHSKAHPRVTKVVPLQNKEPETPSAGPVYFALNHNPQEKTSYSFARLQNQRKALEGQLPPLRGNWYGRHSAVSRAMYFDIPLEQGETSIIKSHPPRRLQKLEPIDLPQAITSGRLLSQKEARTRHKAKQELEKKMQTSMYTSGKRQYLHKMKMLEMNHKRQEAQMELKKEPSINNQKLKDQKVKKILPSIPRNEEYDVLTIVPDETRNRGPGNLQDAELFEYQAENEYGPWKIGKMETLPREQEAQEQLLWDCSDSDELQENEKKPRALVRTRTERILCFDEFYDQE